ncbi:MAG: hypothetical protein ACRC6E_14605 [Fusobacteriaceae bacterium]
MKKANITITVPVDIAEKLRAEAKKNYTTVSSIVTRLIAEMLKKEDKNV